MKTSEEMQLKIIDKMRENVESDKHVYTNIQVKGKGVLSGWLDKGDHYLDFYNCDHRVKPETITINGVEIPKPLSRDEVAELSWGTYVYFMASNDDLFTYKERQFVEGKDFNRVMCFSTSEEAIEASKLLFGIK